MLKYSICPLCKLRYWRHDDERQKLHLQCRIPFDPVPCALVDNTKVMKTSFHLKIQMKINFQ